MESGEPGAPPAPRVRAAVAAALDLPQHYCTPSPGTISLREGLIGYYRDQHGVAVERDALAVTMGSSAAFILAFVGAWRAARRSAGDAAGLVRSSSTHSTGWATRVEIPITA